jgi:hypothetical protein
VHRYAVLERHGLRFGETNALLTTLVRIREFEPLSQRRPHAAGYKIKRRHRGILSGDASADSPPRQLPPDTDTPTDN